VADGGSVSGLDYASGHLLYVRSGTNAGLWTVPFSASRREVAGEPFRVMAEAASVSAASDNTLVMTERADAGPSELVWVERDGRVTGTAGRALAGLMQPALSPDGTRVAAAVAGLAHDICVIDLQSGSVNRLTSDADDDHAPMWSPDARRIVFYRSGVPNVFP
jgi:Tol biopolymer transport system component